ncbi:hypothetical protein [Luteibacter yeojuensis]|uniref:Lipoprotein n=1 Tax=Luteibacter yeojuensis TaxID=345309 RepID=A0A7X5TRD1_9GAMM|nr:hypothetical protein [Luteibacter yeojuensis]NID16412.1 hypothetical protein [Luteibacter yeojuensis]
MSTTFVSRARRALMPCLGVVLPALWLAACAPVASVGKRVDASGDITVGKMQVYSFAPLHAMGSEGLYAGARKLDRAIAERLGAEKMDADVADVEELVRRHGLAVEVTVTDAAGSRHSTALPEREVLAVHNAEESSAGATHRLVILPLRQSIDRATGVAHGVLHWQVETTGDSSPVAVGLMRYTADSRGYPAKRMAAVLVDRLRVLGIR